MPVVLGAASAFTSQRVALYGLISTLAAIAVVFNAFRQRSNFYSATVMLGGSNGCMMVLFNFGVFLSICFGSLCQKIFFGPLRAVELEHLHERLWYAITESLLAMTIFRDDFDSSFALLFGTLLFLKVFHWLSADRVEFMEQSPTLSRWFHIRMIAMLSMLFEFDLFLSTFAVEVLIVDRNRKGIMIMFASEFFILGATLWSIIAKYLINCQDLRSEEPWQAKSVYIFVVDLVTDFLKLATYLACFCLILSYYGLPLNTIRDVYMTGRSFFGRLRDFVQYRAATRNMDTRFPDASTSDLSSMSDGTCIICREEMIVQDDSAEGGEEGDGERAYATNGLNETPKKLPCGHILHFHCLRSWLERQQSCPTCRRTVFTPTNEAGGDHVNEAYRNGDGGGQVPQRARAAEGVGIGQHNAVPTAQERLRSFMQQMQSEAQRVRQQHAEGHNTRSEPRSIPQDAENSHGRSGEANQSQGSAADSSQTTARRMLIKSLFPQHDPLPHQRPNSRTGSHSLLPPAPALQGLSDQSSGAGSDEQGYREKWIPPAPWTLRPSALTSEAVSVKRSELSGNPDTSAPSTVERTEEIGKEEEPPQDAREAARAAALKRFGLHSDDGSVAEKLQTSQGQAKAGPVIPGDPHLIPLFNTEAIENFDSLHASKLTYPLLRSAALPSTRSTSSRQTPQDLVRLAHSAADLENLSLQTRRGLEERLRLLYGVESAVSRMVEDITQALSVFPAYDAVHEDPTQSQDRSGDGKGKLPAEGPRARRYDQA